MNEQFLNEQFILEFEELKRQVEDLRFQLARKTGVGSADIKGRIVNPSSVAGTIEAGSINSAGMFAAGVVDQAAIGANAVGQSELKDEEATVTINAGASSGTASVTSGSVVIGFYPSSNCDQIVKNISVSGTTLTVNLLTNAIATTTIKVVLLKS